MADRVTPMSPSWTGYFDHVASSISLLNVTTLSLRQWHPCILHKAAVSETYKAIVGSYTKNI